VNIVQIGICGCGFVGKSIVTMLATRPFSEWYETRIYDPFVAPDYPIMNLINCKMIFVCVPTPMGKGGSNDLTAIRDVLSKLVMANYQGVVVVKSTITPLSCRKIVSEFPSLRLVTNPEFLTERTAAEDFLNTKWVIIGGKPKDTDCVVIFSRSLWPKAKISEVSFGGAMMIKYMTNVLFATKVALMNEFYALYDALGGTDWQDVIEALKTDTRVGAEHLQVPGPDGDKGFGGKCFPKDLRALTSLAEDMATPRNVMYATWATNKEVRKDKNWLRIDGATTKEYRETDA
jgi:UDPglucose 6-dehydrogenase